MDYAVGLGYLRHLLNMERFKCWICFGHLSASLGCFCPRTSFSKIRMDKLPWTYFISDLHTKLKIINRSVPGLATDSSCGVCGHGWPTCLLYAGPVSGLCFEMIVWYSGEVFSVALLPLFMFYIIEKFALTLPTNNILYQVLCIVIFQDKVSTLSYCT